MSIRVINSDTLRAPFPWFGGKSAIADEVWKRFGRTDNYVEPFFGSGAVLLARPEVGKTETINDKDHYVANFWRAVQHDPESVAHHADWPVNEADLHSRHWWLLTEGADRIRAIDGDPGAFDAQVAGWWVWGACAWIGSGWCTGRGPWQFGASGWGKIGGAEGNAGRGLNRKIPHLGDAGRGINRQIPHLGNAGMGINRQIPHLGNAGRGINRQIPHLGDAGRGINRKIPHLGDAGRGLFIRDWMLSLADRLRDVRVCAGDWLRVCGPSVTHGHGLTAVFLDPPYADTAGRTEDLYAADCTQVAHHARAWAIEQGGNPLMRICLAGYDGEHAMPGDWEVVEWKARGGFGSQNEGDDGMGRVNSTRERLWFSPHCMKIEKQATLFDFMTASA